MYTSFKKFHISIIKISPIIVLIAVSVVIFLNWEPMGFDIGDINLEIADTTAKRSVGLSNRDSLDPDSGILFVFEEEGDYGFWMKEMRFSIDIIWIDENGKIVDIVESATPDSYPQVFRSSEPALYVLEVNSGFVDENRISIGDMLAL